MRKMHRTFGPYIQRGKNSSLDEIWRCFRRRHAERQAYLHKRYAWEQKWFIRPLIWLGIIRSRITALRTDCVTGRIEYVEAQR